jgi:hypothetical protein
VATTHILPIHAGRGRSVARALHDVTGYMENPLKTEGGELISSFECAAQTADTEFLLTKAQYVSLTGRDQGRQDVIAYHTRQSFSPGEITPEEANRIGYELAMRFTKGRHAFIVCTHTDRAHIHNHIVWNSTALDCKMKFRNFIGSSFALRRCSDTLCVERGLSIIKNPKPSPGKDYARYMFPDGKPLSWQNKLRIAIDTALKQNPSSFEEFISIVREAGYTVNTNRKHITFLAPGQKQPTRMDTLRGDYTEAAVRERIGERNYRSSGGSENHIPVASHKPSLLIDIQLKIQQGKGEGYARWAKVFNLKQAAQTLIYLQEQGLDSYDVLKEKTTAATARFNDLSGKIQGLESKLKANAELQKHIVTYSKTRNTYAAYRKAGYSKQFRATHETDIILHQAAKKAFDELGYGKGKKIPSVASLRSEYAAALEEKKKAYTGYRKAKTEMRELLLVKENVDRLLGTMEPTREPEMERTK